MAAVVVRNGLGVALGAALLGLVAQSAMALEISAHPKDSAEVNAILVKGTIDPGNSKDFISYVAKLPKKARTTVYLDSPGGNLFEGMLLGDFFYRNKISTAVESKVRCASACALAFMGGRDSQTGQAMRVKSATGGVGFHSFTREFDKDKSYTAEDMKAVMQKTQNQVALVGRYLRFVDADMEVLRIMVSAETTQMNFVSNETAISLGIQVWDDKSKRIVDAKPVLEKLERERIAATAAVTPTLPETGVKTPAVTMAKLSTRSVFASVVGN